MNEQQQDVERGPILIKTTTRIVLSPENDQPGIEMQIRWNGEEATRLMRSMDHNHDYFATTLARVAVNHAQAIAQGTADYLHDIGLCNAQQRDDMEVAILQVATQPGADITCSQPRPDADSEPPAGHPQDTD